MRNVKNGGEIHVRISDEMFERLQVMAEFNSQPLSTMGALLLEKSIAAEFHAFSVVANRIKSLGSTGNGRDD